MPAPRRNAGLVASWLCLMLSVASISHAQDWPSIIKQLQRSSSRPNKEQLAIAYNNYAIELADQKKFEAAEDYLKKALAADPRNDRYPKNLATVYLNHAFAISDDRQASSGTLHRQARFLAQQALKHDRSLAQAHLLIGDIEYANQNLRQAQVAWMKAKKLDAATPGLQDRLQRLDTEYAVEKQFDRAGNAYFDLRYQDDIDRQAAYDLSSALRQARTAIGRDFNYYPKHRVVVLIYSPESFKKVRRGPDWVAGVYDGKIRLPFPDSKAAQAGVKATLYHEYTHAIIHDLTGSRCPLWLNEGLAEYQEAKLRQTSLAQLREATRGKKLIPLSQLSNGFRSRDVDAALLAYQQSYSLVHFLAKKYSFYRLRRVLQHLGAGLSLDEAFRKEYYLDSAQIEKKWQQWLPDFVR